MNHRSLAYLPDDIPLALGPKVARPVEEPDPVLQVEFRADGWMFNFGPGRMAFAPHAPRYISQSDLAMLARDYLGRR